MRSMTGYGSASVTFAEITVTVEVRTVNHRYGEVKITAPHDYLAWENEFRQLVRDRVARGRAEVTISLSRPCRIRYTVEPNLDLAQGLLRAWQGLKKELRLTGEVDLSFFQNRPDLFHIAEEPRNLAAEAAVAKKSLRRALIALERERRREGRHLLKDMTRRVGMLDKIWRAIERRSYRVKRNMQEKAKERLSTLLRSTTGGVIDDWRLRQEVALLVQRSDITEEMVRLRSHLQALGALLRDRGAVGRKIDFLLQEVHRELNTVGAKSEDVTLSRLMVEGKAEVEKLREQVQNVE